MNPEAYRPAAAVFVIIRNEQGEILLHRRQNTTYLNGYYDFPSGRVDENESFQAAASRELAEETGLTAEAGDMHLVHLNQNMLDFPYVNILFVADKWQGNPKIMEPNKCDDMQFFALDNLPDKCTLAVRLAEQNGFSASLTYSYVDLPEYQRIMGEPFVSGR